MSTPIITVENLSKCYQLGQIGATTLRDSAQRFLDRLRWRRTAELSANGYQLSRKTTNNQQPITNNDSSPNDEFWALKDVSFEVQPGEVLGIIGRNGAGKSTLLKILSRITEPTSGRAIIRGRMASLLEVGTGFHPELTGRENIFLNGAILGMKKAEIARKFDEIVAFAEVDRFIDTPVKHYSSGMYVRLAFAVAAHLEPEILLVDEVLAVGDMEFQKKCLGKMDTVAKEGRTVLFVSHNMAAVQQLCSHGVVMERGMVECDGEIASAITHHANRNRIIRSQSLRERSDRQGNGSIRFTYIDIVSVDGQKLDYVMTGMDIEVRLHYEALTPFDNATILASFNVINSLGLIITNLNSVDSGQSRMTVYRKGMFVCRWPKVGLKSGTYTGTLFCSINGTIADWVPNGIEINVETGDFYGSGKVIERAQGDVVFMHNWFSLQQGVVHE
jgi:lipopolysaccharide transport system ATP-binding protein